MAGEPGERVHPEKALPSGSAALDCYGNGAKGSGNGKKHNDDRAAQTGS
jgi:hypothetical protein